MQVQLFKKVGTYPDKETGKEKRFTNFYLKCGDALVPVAVCYFPQDKFDGRDPQYNGRKEVLSAFATPLPDKHDSGDGKAHKSDKVENTLPPDAQPVDDIESALNGF